MSIGVSMFLCILWICSFIAYFDKDDINVLNYPLVITAVYGVAKIFMIIVALKMIFGK